MEIDPALLSPDVKTFEAALTAFHALAGRTMDDSIAAIDLLNKDELLGSTEIARRARLLLGQAILSEVDAQKLVASASRWQPAVKLSIQLGLTPEQRQRIYSPKSAPSQPEQRVPIKPAPLVGKGTLAARLEVMKLVSVPEPTEQDFKSVLLLGSAEAHESNIRFLKTKDFSPIRISSPAELDASLGGEICGVILRVKITRLFAGSKSPTPETLV